MPKLKIKKNQKVFLALCLLFILFRLFVLFNSDKLNHPEECVVGSIANSIKKNYGFNLFELQYGNHVAGELLTGLITVLTFSVFGESVFALKLSNLLLSFIIFVLTKRFLSKYFGERASIIGAFIMIFSPPYFTLYNLIAIANYLVSTFFNVVLLFYFFKFFYENKFKLRDLIIAGFLFGIGIYLHPSLVPTLVLFGLFWFFKDKLFFLSKKFLIFLYSFIIGISPGVIYYFNYSTQGVEKLIGLLNLPSEIFYKFISLFSYQIPDSMYFFNFLGVNRLIFSYIYYSLLIFSFVYLVVFINRNLKKSRENTKYIIVIGYLVLFSIIYVFTNLNNRFVDFSTSGAVNAINYEFLFSMYFYFILLLTLAIDLIFSKKKLFGKLLFIIVILLGLIGNLSLVSFNTNIEETYSPTCISTLGIAMGSKYGKNLEIVEKYCHKLNDSEYINGCYVGVGIKSMQISQRNVTQATNFCYMLEEKYIGKCIEGIGSMIGNKPDVINSYGKLINKPYRKYFYSGVGIQLGSMTNFETEELRDMCEKHVDSNYVEYCVYGAG